MIAAGIIAEYNPLHKGHRYHIDQTLARTGADVVVCAMSGNFTQRGEPAIIDKWARTEMALQSGIDLVIEIPVVYAMASAEYFAYAGVKLLDSLGVIDYLSFGSENGDIGPIEIAAAILNCEPPEYKTALKASLDKGNSYAAARDAALGSLVSLPDNLLKGSNNILAIEYIKALRKLDSNIKPVSVTRLNSYYNSLELEGRFSSASAIRNMILENGLTPENSADYLPTLSADILTREFNAGRGPVFSKDFDLLLISILRQMKTEEIAALPYMGEGLEMRIKTAAGMCRSLQELVESISTKRYPRTRIRRILFHILTGLTGSAFELFNKAGGPQYIRILGFNEKGRVLMSKFSTSAKLPVITKTADYINHISGKSDNPLVAQMLQFESASTDQYMLACKGAHAYISGQEFTRKVVLVNHK